jgi:hypothetical protein
MRYLTFGTARRLTASIACVAVVMSGVPLPASGAIIGTDAVLAAEGRIANLARIDRVMTSAHVRERMQQLGVDGAQVEARLAALTDAELASFADRLERAPAGGELLEVVGVVFVVLLILELVGVIDIFKTIGKVRTVN